jgi:hypothetical protein
VRRLVEERGHPLTTVNARWFEAWVHYQRGDATTAASLAAEVIAMSVQHGFTGWPDGALVLTHAAPGGPVAVGALAELQRRLVSAWTGGAVWRQVKMIECQASRLSGRSASTPHVRGSCHSSVFR